MHGTVGSTPPSPGPSVAGRNRISMDLSSSRHIRDHFDDFLADFSYNMLGFHLNNYIFSPYLNISHTFFSLCQLSFSALFEGLAAQERHLCPNFKPQKRWLTLRQLGVWRVRLPLISWHLTVPLSFGSKSVALIWRHDHQQALRTILHSLRTTYNTTVTDMTSTELSL